MNPNRGTRQNHRIKTGPPAVLWGGVILLLALAAASCVGPQPSPSPLSPRPPLSATSSRRPSPTSTASPVDTPPPSSTATPENTPVVCPTIPPTQAISPTYHYMFPVQPPSLVTYGPYHHDYPATDIFGPIGTPVVAVTNGLIDELSREDHWDPATDDPALRGGLYVSIIGDDGVRYYTAHLDTVVPWLEPGMRVVAGQIIGYLGKSGNARWTDPHVHFGLSRPTYPGDWQVRRGEIPPYDYLQAWVQGQELRPELP